jgi:hypothetical protein
MVWPVRETRCRWALAASAIIVGVVFAGCGDGTTKRSSGTGASPSHPLYPGCVFSGFDKPKVFPAPGARPGTSRGWRILYLPPPLSAVHPGQTNNVTILERSPALRQGPVKGGRTTNVAGRRVSLLAPSATYPLYVASWKTARASYLVLGNGKRANTLKRFIACLP